MAVLRRLRALAWIFSSWFVLTVCAGPSDEGKPGARVERPGLPLAAATEEELQRFREGDTLFEATVAFVFRGLMDLTREQLEKVDRAATGREESRYAQTTLPKAVLR